MKKRTVHMEVSEETFVDTDGLNRGLQGLADHANDACDFEEILRKAIQSLYESLPEGIENYRPSKEAKKPIIGAVYLNRFNNKQGPGNGHTADALLAQTG